MYELNNWLHSHQEHTVNYFVEVGNRIRLSSIVFASTNILEAWKHKHVL